MNIDIQIKNAEPVIQALSKIGEQAPFAMALTLNDTANAAQTAIRNGLSARFTLRRKDFILNTIYRQKGVDFATKRELSAAVRVNSERDVLAKFEDGGQKTPLVGRNVAIPLPGVKRNKNDIVTKANRPAGLIGKPGVARIETKAGTFLVQTKRGGRGMGARTEFLYQLKPSVPIKPVLSFVKTANDEVDRVFVRLALAAIDYALATA
jgi:hypothetical protein